MVTLETARKELEELVVYYEENRDQYHQKGYDEIKFRNNIINRFFKILGWDVNNDENLPEYNRDVIIHYRIKGKYSTIRPDYAFGLLAQLKPLFFVEAKTPATIIKDHKDSAHQIRRYGKSAGLAVSILTNFEEFAVYDCTLKIKDDDKATVGRLEYFTYKDYLDKFDFLWNTFSKEAVKKGKFEKYILTEKPKKGSVPPDKGFVEKLNEWREYLATNIGLLNPGISEDDLNYAVQVIIDRIIFLRFCEDRSIEHFESLKKAAQKGNVLNNLFELFKKADEKYNSGLFDFSKDIITPKIKIDNKILKNIIEDLYKPKTEYEFGIVPVEILGNAYEQFLGHVIRISPSGKAKIVEKPEVKKAGGVFYTPQYIVDYIVENTVGRLINGKTPEEISKIKIVDPACGSGSFLLGAYVCLLKYHSEYYWKKEFHKKKLKDSPVTPEGRLKVSEKKRILKNNIFGVDIDANAVEVTKLSLLLKAMEGETEESIYQQLKAFNERALPDLDENIKCGNSLIGYNIFDGSLDLDNKEKKELEKKLKPFDWKTAFPEVFKQGGFDAVIGNPPWVSLTGKFGNDILNEKALKYLINKYRGNSYMPNLYEYFVHKGLELFKSKGYFSFIVPDRLGYNKQFIFLRKKILECFTLEELIYKASFPNITTDTLIFRIYNKKRSESYDIKVGEFGMTLQLKKSTDYLNNIEHQYSYEINDLIGKILNKIFSTKKNQPLGKIIDSTSGFGGRSQAISDKKTNQRQIEILRGRSIQKYLIVDKFYFEFKKSNITGRTTDTRKLGAKEKVLLRKTGFPIYATYDKNGIYPEQSLYFLFNNKTNLSLKYITALINSKLFQFCYWHRLVTNRDSTPQLKKVDLDRFPVFIPDLKNKKEQSAYNEIVRLVDNLLELNKEIQKNKRPDVKDRMLNNIKYCENRIDELVYELYGLTKDEIFIIENNLKQ